MKLTICLLLCSLCPAATVLRIACGTTQPSTDAAGNTWRADTGYSGGAAWTPANQAALASQPVPYRSLRYSATPGAPFGYLLVLPPSSNGAYVVKLKFSEPQKTGPGQRMFSVALNGVPAISNMDLFAAAPGALVPLDRSFPLTSLTGALQISLTASAGNAVLSGIQVDTVDAPPVLPNGPQPPQTPVSGAILTGTFVSCQGGWVGATDLKTPGASQEVTVLANVGGDWRIDHVLLCEIQQFAGPAGVTYTASAGRPGSNHDELTGTLLPLGVSGENCWYSRPTPPQFTAPYSVVVNVASTGDISQLTGGLLVWEMCGYSALVGGAPATILPYPK